MGYGVFLALIVVAFAFGIAVQMILQPKSRYDWIVAALGAAFGAYVGSEVTWTQWFPALTNLGPELDGLLLVPAVIGGLVLGAIFEVVARMVEEPTAA